jgi:hypothetical protein
MDSTNSTPNTDDVTVFPGSLKVRDAYGTRLFTIPLQAGPTTPPAKSQTTGPEEKNEKAVKIVPTLTFKVAVGGILALALFPPIRLNESGLQYLLEKGYKYEFPWEKVQLRFIFGETAWYGSVALGHLLVLGLVWSLGVWLLAPYAAGISEKWSRKSPRDKTANSKGKINWSALPTAFVGITLAAGVVSILYIAISHFIEH